MWEHHTCASLHQYLYVLIWIQTDQENIFKATRTSKKASFLLLPLQAGSFWGVNPDYFKALFTNDSAKTVKNLIH